MAILTIIEAILGRLAADEIKAWLPTLSQKALTLAVSRLPQDKRQRYAEEWQAHLIDIPGDLSKFIYGLGQVRAALTIAGIHRAASRPSTIHRVQRYITGRQREIAGRINMTLASVVWLSVPRLAGGKAGDRFAYIRHARYPLLYQMVKVGAESGECPLWLSCLVTVTISITALNWKWLQSMNRKWLEFEKT